jgi:hypothetical protein
MGQSHHVYGTGTVAPLLLYWDSHTTVVILGQSHHFYYSRTVTPLTILGQSHHFYYTGSGVTVPE